MAYALPNGGGSLVSYGTPKPGSTSAARNSAVPSGAQALSYGPKYGSVDMFPTGQPLTYGSGTPKTSTFGGAGFIDSFLSTLSLGSGGSKPTSTPDANGNVYSGRGSYGMPTASGSQNTVNVDGGSDFLSKLGNLANMVSAVTGSSGDGNVQPTQVSFQQGGGSGINPLYIAGAAVAVGAAYYLLAR